MAVIDWAENDEQGASTSATITFTNDATTTPSDGEIIVKTVAIVSTTWTGVTWPTGFTELATNAGARGSSGVAEKKAASEGSNAYTTTVPNNEWSAGGWVVSGAPGTGYIDLVVINVYEGADQITISSDADSPGGEESAQDDEEVLAAGFTHATSGGFTGSWSFGGTATYAGSPADEPAGQTTGSSTDITGTWGHETQTAAGIVTATSPSKSGSLSERFGGFLITVKQGAGGATATPKGPLGLALHGPFAGPVGP